MKIEKNKSLNLEKEKKEEKFEEKTEKTVNKTKEIKKISGIDERLIKEKLEDLFFENSKESFEEENSSLNLKENETNPIQEIHPINNKRNENNPKKENLENSLINNGIFINQNDENKKILKNKRKKIFT
jgi:hypothetical protein